MSCYLCFLGGSKSWIPLLLPGFAVFASFLSIPISLSLLFILFSTLYSFFTLISKKNQILVVASSHEEEKVADHEVVSSLQQQQKEEEEEKENSQDLYSESESMDHFSSSSVEELYDEHSSDVECWPYDSMEQKFDLSDDSISDEESLIEISIPSGQVSPEKDPKYINLNNYSCKFSKDHHHFSLHKYSALDFLNEEDNLIEIDIYMGSIKSSSYGIQTAL